MTTPGPSSSALTPFAWINQTYGLRIEVGTEFLFCGTKGVVVQDHGNYLGVRLFGGSGVVSIHPTWSVEYLPRGKGSQINPTQAAKGSP